MNSEHGEQPYEHYEETRKYPRIHIHLPIALYFDDKKSVTATIYDISPDGLQIRCNRTIAANLNPSGKRISLDDNVTVNTKFFVQIEGEQHEVAVSCKIYYFLILPGVVGEDVAFGLKFMKFEGQSIRHIGSLIENELEPTIV